MIRVALIHLGWYSYISEDMETFDQIYTLIFFFCVSPLALLQNLEKYKFLNTIYFLLFLTILITISWLYLTGFKMNVHIDEKRTQKDIPQVDMLTTLVLFIGVSSFSLESVSLMLPIRSTIKIKTDFYFYYYTTIISVILMTVWVGFVNIEEFGAY